MRSASNAKDGLQRHEKTFLAKLRVFSRFPVSGPVSTHIAQWAKGEPGTAITLVTEEEN